MFEPITLEQMDNVKLMNRVDSKYMLTLDLLPQLLLKAVGHFKVLEINNLKSSRYSSIYFDTDDMHMYRMHHNGKLNRFKIRMRTYVESGDTFLEVKRKTNKGRTSKKRIGIDPSHFNSMSFHDEEENFIHEITPYLAKGLTPQLQNQFTRITLVDNNETERITIDTGIKFKTADSNTYSSIEQLVIVEIKQDGSVRSKFHDILEELSVSSQRISKYCLGVILTQPQIKHNRFNTKIRQINKLSNNDPIRTTGF